MSISNTSSLQNPDTNHSFMSKHKKNLIIAGISATAVAAIYYAYTNGYFSGELLSKSKEFLSSFAEKLLEITKYSVNFFKENLIISSIVTVIAVLITYFTYQAYKKRSEENEQEQKIYNTIIINLSELFNDLMTKLKDKNEIDQTDLIDTENKITPLGNALLNLINAYDKITNEMLNNEKFKTLLDKIIDNNRGIFCKHDSLLISYQDKDTTNKKITILLDNFKISESKKDEKTTLHLPEIIQKLKPLKDILVPSAELKLNDAKATGEEKGKEKA